MQRAIITGATGAIGMALIKELIRHNVEVLILKHPGSGRNERIPLHPLVSCRDCALEQLYEIKNDTGKKYDVFFHLAWAGTFGDARSDQYMQLRNVRYSLDAVAAAKAFGCERFIGAGSQAEYGNSRTKLTAETPTFPNNGYGYAKLCAGQMTRDYACQLGLEHIWVRVLSVYGPYDGEKTMIMSVLNQLVQGVTPKLTSGEQEWDYLYSEDAAKALYLLAESGKNKKIYVLGSGKARKISEYVEEIRVIVNPKVDIAFGAVPYHENQIMYLCADIEELKNDIGFQPEVSFAQGIREVLRILRRGF